jgi:hypothetical protein
MQAREVVLWPEFSIRNEKKKETDIQSHRYPWCNTVNVRLDRVTKSPTTVVDHQSLHAIALRWRASNDALGSIWRFISLVVGPLVPGLYAGRGDLVVRR